MATASARDRRITASKKRIDSLRTRKNKHQATLEEVTAQLEYEEQVLSWVEQMPATATEAELPAEGELASEAREEAQEFVADPFSQTAGVNPELPIDEVPSEDGSESLPVYEGGIEEAQYDYVGSENIDEPKRGRKAKAAAEG